MLFASCICSLIRSLFAASTLFGFICYSCLQLPPRSIPGRGQFSKLSSHPNGVRLFARYTQAADNLFSSRLQGTGAYSDILTLSRPL